MGSHPYGLSDAFAAIDTLRIGGVFELPGGDMFSHNGVDLHFNIHDIVLGAPDPAAEVAPVPLPAAGAAMLGGLVAPRRAAPPARLTSGDDGAQRPCEEGGDAGGAASPRGRGRRGRWAARRGASIRSRVTP